MKQRIYRNYFWVALTTILIVSFVFVFSYNRTIHDQKEEGMREEANSFLHFWKSKEMQMSVFRRQPERQTFASP